MIGLLLTLKEWGADLWRFAKTPFGRRAIMLAIAALVVWGYGEARFKAGVQHERAVWTKAAEKAAKKVAKVEAKGDAITADVAGKHDVAVAEIRWRTKILKEEVPVYVPLEVDRAVVVPSGFVSLHDAAVSGAALPETPGGPVEAPSGIALSEVGDAIVDNYSACRIIRQEALAWREWYPRQADLWKKEYGAPSP